MSAGPVRDVDAVVVGSGPNGLAAAVVLARAGLLVVVLEAESTLGGGARTLDLGLAPGLTHDLCSAVHPLAVASPFFRAFDLRARGVDLVTPDVSYGQPLEDGQPLEGGQTREGRQSLEGGQAALAHRDLGRTVAELGADGPAWERLFRPLLAAPDAIVAAALSDKRSLPRPAGGQSGADPVTAARALASFGLRVGREGTALWNLPWRTEAAKALLTGVTTHAIGRQPSLATAGTGMLLALLGHVDGWPLPIGGSQAITDALLADLAAHGGEIRTGVRVRSTEDLPPARAVLFDTTAEAAAAVLGDALPVRVARGLRGLGHGPGAAKVDLVLDGPIPWCDGAGRAGERARRGGRGLGDGGAGEDGSGDGGDGGVRGLGDAGTVHVGGTRAEMAAAEAQVAAGRMPARPVVLVSDPGRFDPSRVVDGLRPVWAYAHVPADCPIDPTRFVLGQLERFAPGIRERVVAMRGTPASRMAEHNANLVGGDISGGRLGLARLVARPRWAWQTKRLAGTSAYLCSAATTPGPGVHGMAGFHAAREVLAQRFGIREDVPLAP